MTILHEKKNASDKGGPYLDRNEEKPMGEGKTNIKATRTELHTSSSQNQRTQEGKGLAHRRNRVLKK